MICSLEILKLLKRTRTLQFWQFEGFMQYVHVRFGKSIVLAFRIKSIPHGDLQGFAQLQSLCYSSYTGNQSKSFPLDGNQVSAQPSSVPMRQ